MGLAEDAVDAINGIFGSHAGHRAAHAKGTLLAGSFTATPDAARLTRAAHMQGEPLRATARFSNGAGDPGVPDYAKEQRGLAVKLYLPDDSKTDLVALSLPVFFVRTPRTSSIHAPAQARPGDAAAGHGQARRLVRRAPRGGAGGPGVTGAPSRPPAMPSWPTTACMRSAGWDADGESRFVRFRLGAGGGRGHIPSEEAGERGRDYLQNEILERVRASRPPSACS